MKLIVVSSLMLMLLGCGSDDKQSATNGEALFNEVCADCHKKSGKGNFLAGIPANATTELSSEQIVVLITQGLPAYKQMPVFSGISEDQAKAIANHLKTLRP
ncbi:MAG: cytochrome c [Motiliproteus sp.]